MEFTVPDTVEFLVEVSRPEGGTYWRAICFRHAVKRALQGEDIEVKLTDRGYTSCEDCSG